MKVAVIFGGAGYIGSFLIRELIKRQWFDAYYVCDIKKSERELFRNDNRCVKYFHCDVRNRIKISLPKDIDLKHSWIFNLAAVHREPGHEYKEYFDTNIPGAENINEFARKTGVKNIMFTSSIAPYGRSLEQRDEHSKLYPETAYGISKAIAERIHREWLAEDEARRLIIVRPSVIFGPRDPGNVFRMIKALKKGSFVLPNGGNIIKGYGYVYGLVESMVFTMKKIDESLIVYNYAENPLLTLNEMVLVIKNELNFSKPTLKLPVSLLAVIAGIFHYFFKIIGRKSDIHPVRVLKAGFPTNIKPKYLIDNGFEFKYDFRNALLHWKSEEPKDFDL